jgi:hypothetical protein
VLDQIGAIERNRFKGVTLRRKEKLTQRHCKALSLASVGGRPRKEPCGIRRGFLAARDHLHYFNLLLE